MKRYHAIKRMDGKPESTQYENTENAYERIIITEQWKE